MTTLRDQWELFWERAGGRVVTGCLILATVVCAYWVVSASKSEGHGRPIELDFLWPTYTPQKVRYGEYLKEEYEKRNPDVHVNLIKTQDPYKKLQIMIAGRTAPDVVWMGVGWEQFAAALLNVEEKAANDPEVEVDAYFPGLWNAVRWQGSARALPSSGQMGVLYYNKDMFREAGLDFPTADWTWDDMVNMAETLTRDADGDGVVDRYGLQLGQIYIVPFMLYDGQIADEDWRTAKVHTPVTEALMNDYRALMHEKRVMPTPTASAELGMLPMFEAGRVAMHAASGYAIESFRKVPFDWDVVSLPWYEFEGERNRATGLWQEEFGVLWNSDVPDVAWDFAKFCTSKEMIEWAAYEGHIVPGRVDVGTGDAYLQDPRKPDNMRAFIDSLEFAVPVYPHPWWRRINREFTPIMDQFFRGSEGVRIEADDMLRQLDEVLQGILDEYHAEQAG
jgi:multiple sugar transport system substrate-binding protein